ncbi:MAG TPA: hypothetical protein PK036_08700 [Geobacteraceae bacterium]|nr:hypothetical protein [Geobacteraceae bacterium]
MSLAIIDAREWQRVFDLRTGAGVEEINPLLKMVMDIQARRPYPGDLDDAGNRWVTDTALDLIAGYDPSFVYLTYARQFFVGRYSVLTEREWAGMVSSVFGEVNRFVARSGFTPVIVGTGGMIPFVDFIDVTRLDGLVLSTHWSARYAGLHDGSRRDLQGLAALPEIERIVPRHEFRSFFAECPGDASRMPEYLLVARPGYMFRTVGGAFRKVRRVPAPAYAIPLAAESGVASSITDIRRLVVESLRERKIALIVVEGLGMDDFPWPHQRCENGRGWFYYEPGDAQYLTLTTGRHQVFEYPTGYKYFDEDAEKKEYPLSGYFTSVPADTIASGLGVRSLAVGNRSMLMHMAPGADISIECFARNLFNQGTMAVIHRMGTI